MRPSPLIRAALVVVGVILAAPAVALADGNAVKEVEEQTHKAMESYDLMDFEEAQRILTDAIDRAEASSLEDPVVARAYVSLGIVQFSGLGQESRARQAFENAVRIDPEVEIDIGYRSSELEELLASVRDGAATSGAGANPCDVEGLQHALIDRATAGAPREVQARLGAEVEADQVVAYYRAEGELEFSEVILSQAGACGYQGNIPGSAVRGSFVHYYVAALDGEGEVVASAGTSGSPNIIEVAELGDESLGDRENPLGEDGSVEAGVKVGGDEPRVFLSIAAGTGGGYVTGTTEARPSEVQCCTAWALFHLMPELGVYLSRQLSLSGAFRMGFPVGANVEGHATFAPAGLLRVRYLLSRSGEGFEVSAAMGGGFIRNTVALDNAPAEMDTDTTAAGPILVGAGVGYQKSLGGPMKLAAELNSIAGISAGFEEVAGVRPNFGLQFDLNLALLFVF